MLPVIAISIGDINGIGPEVLLKAFHRSDLFDICRPVVFGPPEVLHHYHALLGLKLSFHEVRDAADAREGQLNLFSVPGDFVTEDIGRPTEESGRISIDAIRTAYFSVRDDKAQALVTAPISKEAIAMAGSPFHGHTDMLASFCECGDDVLMILSNNTMNVGLVTVHVPLREVASRITREEVERAIRLGHLAMEEDFGVEEPRIAVLALNPHAGDGGILGMEEQRIILPAIEAQQREGIRAEGPFPADGFFSAHNRELYDLVIAMYHDQGLVPFKLQAMGRGVNITAGLPIVRTSPDHGTAFGIASHGIASAESMKEAVYFARTIVLNRLQ
ncbi:MAG: 4-hydroxythreonine-4-phosphate dehydrogenase PdxA [Bacteroidetes bacterium]|nr:4-hydroxythreonine-4-phosphate dehydrogenase PdxA [Bacteroidota bacterium]